MAKQSVPVNEVLRLSKSGYTDADIITYLREQGYSATAINDAINQAKVKRELERTAGYEEEPEEYPQPVEYGEETEEAAEETEGGEEEMEPSIMEQEEYEEELPAAPRAERAPAPGAEAAAGAEYPYAYEERGASTEAMEELAEEIINEKWQEFKSKMGDVGELKAAIEAKLRQIDARMKKVETTTDKLQLSVISQLRQSSETIKAMDSQVQAMQNVFSQILEPLISSVKELRDLTEEVRGKKTAAAKLKPIVEKLEKAAKVKTEKAKAQAKKKKK